MATVTYTWTNFVGSFFANNSITAGNQAAAAITALQDGQRYFVSWDDPQATLAVDGRVIEDNSVPLAGQFAVNSTNTNHQFQSSLAALTDGNAVAVFTDTSTDAGGDIRARLFNSNGAALGPDFGVASSATADSHADVAALADGGFAVTWTRSFGGGDKEIRGAVLGSDGAIITGLVVVDSDAPSTSSNSSQVAGLANGNFVVAWQQEPAAGGASEVHYRIFDADGDPLTAARLIDNNGSINGDIQIVALQDGGFALAYTDNGWARDGTEITLRIFNADGTARTGPRLVNSSANGGTTVGNQDHPTLTLMSNGYILVGWSNGPDLIYQAYGPRGKAAGENFNPAGNVIEAEIAGLSGGLVANVRSSTIAEDAGNPDDSIRTSIQELTRSAVGNGTSEILIGDSLRDFMSGAAGNDLLAGGAGDDSLNGGSGNDTLRGGAGSDVLDGGQGVDDVSYASASSGVTVDLATAGAQNTGGAGIDTLISLDNITGSAFNDVLCGNANANTIIGGSGNDVIEGRGGNDRIDGGAGADWASYTSAGAGVTVNLATAGPQETGGAGIDTLVSINRLIGSAFADHLSGNASNNIFVGGGGNDLLQGRGGDDVLIGQAGADQLTGGTGSNTFVYQSVSDSTLALRDVITDFGAGDRIDLSAIDADTTSGGNQAFHLDGTTGGAGDIGITLDAANNRTVIDLYVNNDATADARIWLSGNHVALAAASLVL